MAKLYLYFVNIQCSTFEYLYKGIAINWNKSQLALEELFTMFSIYYVAFMAFIHNTFFYNCSNAQSNSNELGKILHKRFNLYTSYTIPSTKRAIA